eukprot:COSAG02_NODE_284_length_25691_cov_14.733354_23_plen_42_part_00
MILNSRQTTLCTKNRYVLGHIGVRTLCTIIVLDLVILRFRG